MMLHRHFENSKPQNMTTLAEMTPVVKQEEPVVIPDEPVEAPKKRGKKSKAD